LKIINKILKIKIIPHLIGGIIANIDLHGKFVIVEEYDDLFADYFCINLLNYQMTC